MLYVVHKGGGGGEGEGRTPNSPTLHKTKSNKIKKLTENASLFFWKAEMSVLSWTTLGRVIICSFCLLNMSTRCSDEC